MDWASDGNQIAITLYSDLARTGFLLHVGFVLGFHLGSFCGRLIALEDSEMIKAAIDIFIQTFSSEPVFFALMSESGLKKRWHLFGLLYDIQSWQSSWLLIYA
jgi:ABC-type dipeptide/oligopeptide/nickel transport system permease component